MVRGVSALSEKRRVASPGSCEAYDLMTCAKRLGNQAGLVCR